MFEERKNLLTAMLQKEKRTAIKHTYRERLKENQVHIERIRAMLLSRDKSAKNSN
jgi:two-component system, chemotaxis family, protein-glutamate methylesterase/glutaminase